MSTPRVAVAVQHHVSRRSLLPPLLKALAPLRVDVAADPDPDAPALAWRSYRVALEQTPAWATHRVVIQDDAIPYTNFATEVAKRIAARPGRVLVLFHGSEPAAGAHAAREAAALGLRWADADTATFLPVVAVVWPCDEVTRVLAWADRTQPHRGSVGDDWILGRYCRDHQIRPLVAVPNLVEHPDRVPSIVQRHYQGPPRTSCCPPR